jgi:hypothetical protein
MSAYLSAKARVFSQTWSTMPSSSITSLVALYVRFEFEVPYIKEKQKNKKYNSSDTGDNMLVTTWSGTFIPKMRG